MIVVDASVLTDVLLGRPVAVDALEQEALRHPGEPLHAPALIEPETLSALRGLVRGGHVSDTDAGQVAANLEHVRLIRYPHEPLRARVWELRHELTPYDATYLALAEAIEGAVLMTADGGLARRARRSLGDERVLLAA